MEDVSVKSQTLSPDLVLFSVVIKKLAKPIGVALLNLKTDEITNLLIDGDFKRSGFGTKLIQEIEKYAKEHNMQRVFATTHSENLPTRALFKKLRYVEWIKLEKKIET